MREFDYTLDYQNLNLRRRPDLYRIGRGEQGVLLVQPYKDEILPYWRFKTVMEARKSAHTIYKLFQQYKSDSDFVGMDMARKFLQMGFTRARRYANHKSGANTPRTQGACWRPSPITQRPPPRCCFAAGGTAFDAILSTWRRERSIEPDSKSRSNPTEGRTPAAAVKD